MKTIFCITSFLVALACISYADKVRITADNVNIRADSNLNSRVMGQVSRDTILESRVTEDEWIGVLPPENICGWIHSGLVVGGKITASRAHIRSGPGINYQVISNLSRDDSPAVQGTFGEWLKVPLPEGTLVWVSRKFAEPLNVPKPELPSAPLNDQSPPETPAPSHTGIAAKPPKPADPNVPLEQTPGVHTGGIDKTVEPLSASGVTSNMLVQTEEQAIQVSRKGKLKKASIVWRRPSRYILTGKDKEGNESAICYVTGSDKQLEALLQREITVEGKQYIIQGARFPLLIASRITIH